MNYELMAMKADLHRAKRVARKFGYTANDNETAEGLVRNILTVLNAVKAENSELQKQLAKLRKEAK